MDRKVARKSMRISRRFFEDVQDALQDNIDNLVDSSNVREAYGQTTIAQELNLELDNYKRERAAIELRLAGMRLKNTDLGVSRFDRQLSMNELGMDSFANVSPHANEFVSEEFDKLQYTAVHSKAEAFVGSGYKLRCTKLGRRPQLMVVITINDEPVDMLKRTLRAVCSNIQDLEMRDLSAAFQPVNESFEKQSIWKEVCVVLVCDGRSKMDRSSLAWLNSIGLCNWAALTSGGAPEVHLFERTVLLDYKDDEETSLECARGWNTTLLLPPVQMVFALKEESAGKLDSHQWFFEAFCEDVNPVFCMTLDVGTMPARRSFRKLLSEMTVNRKVGAACGEIVVDSVFYKADKWIVAAQNFEYKMTAVMDKAMESAIGFISSGLPGAFSAYRWKAIQGPPLRKYFFPLRGTATQIGPFVGNTYLASDRILYFELFASTGKHWTLKYVEGATARATVPDSLPAFLSSRRRWANGNFFATFYLLRNSWRVLVRSGHNPLRKLLYLLFLPFKLALGLFQWLSMSIFFCFVYFSVFTPYMENAVPFIESGYVSQPIFSLLALSYAAVIFMQLVFGLGHKPTHVADAYSVINLYYLMVLFFGVTTIVLLLGWTDTFDAFFLYCLGASSSAVLIALTVHGSLFTALFSLVQYLMYLPVLTNIVVIYSMCNLQDLTLGAFGRDGLVNSGLGNLNDEEKNPFLPAPNEWDQRELDAAKKEQAGRIAGKKNEERTLMFNSFRTSVLGIYFTSQALAIFFAIRWLDTRVFNYGLVLFFTATTAVKFTFFLLFCLQTLYRKARFKLWIDFGVGGSLGKEDIDMRRAPNFGNVVKLDKHGNPYVEEHKDFRGDQITGYDPYHDTKEFRKMRKEKNRRKKRKTQDNREIELKELRLDPINPLTESEVKALHKEQYPFYDSDTEGSSDEEEPPWRRVQKPRELIVSKVPYQTAADHGPVSKSSAASSLASVPEKTQSNKSSREKSSKRTSRKKKEDSLPLTVQHDDVELDQITFLRSKKEIKLNISS